MPLTIELTSSEKVEALDQLIASDGWALVLERLALQLSRDLADLEREVGPEQTIKLRAQVGRMRMLMDLPLIMRDGFKQELPK